jgi:hypothetical protein
MSNAPVSIVSKDILTFIGNKYHNKSVLTLRGEFEALSDEDIARFLIARNGDVEKARVMLQEHIKWREDYPWPIYKEECLGELHKGKVYLHGEDKDGHPLVVFRPAKNDMDIRDVGEMGRMALWWTDVIFKSIPSHLSKVTLLVNRLGGENNADVPFIRAFTSVMQSNYPERLHKAIIYPSGWIFWGLWNMLKYLADPVTQAKVSPVVRLSGVQEFVEDKYIPRELGGECDYDFNANAEAIIAALDDPFPKEEEGLESVFTGLKVDDGSGLGNQKES